MSRVSDIMERVNKRTESMIGDVGEQPASERFVGALVPPDECNLMFVGLPLTMLECEEYLETLRLNMIEMAMSGVPPELGVEALLRHAVMFGLLAHTVEGG